MKLIVGLGNPGPEYNLTRHNFGFMALDVYAKKLNLDWNKTPKFHSLFLEYQSVDERCEKIILLKPQTFYNDSGLAVSECMNFYKIPKENLLIVCDNFDLDFTKLRLHEKGTTGGNNGLKSITNSLGTDDYARLRLGTKNTALRERLGDVNFVLSKFTAEEKALLPDVLAAATAKIADFISK